MMLLLSLVVATGLTGDIREVAFPLEPMLAVTGSLFSE
jgi:hypothetical protein